MVSQNELSFGDVLIYNSTRTHRKTPCIYVRKKNDSTAVVLFQHAREVAKVDCCKLERQSFECSEELNKLFDDVVRR